MIVYYDLPIPLRSLVVLGFFLELCVGGCLLPPVFRRNLPLPKILVPLGMAVSGCFLILYTAEARARLMDQAVPYGADRLCSLPLLLSLLVFLLILAYHWYLFRDVRRYHRTTITRSSIKEGVDKISSGLCFYRNGGRVILVNRRMNELSFAIAGTDLQNAGQFWQILQNGPVSPKVERLSSGSRPSFRLPDGAVWSFAHDTLHEIHQLSAAETTQIQAVTDALKEKNTALADLNDRLRRHGENVDELTRSRERLETKARIHSELGQALLSTRRYLLEEEGEQHVPLDLWERSIAMLRREAVLKEEEQPLEMLARIADSTGISIQIHGELPPGERVQRLFVQAAAEALTNAISHAQAKSLHITLEEDGPAYAVSFRNDGRPPAGRITEGGGLSSLRKKIEQEGGTMDVHESPAFCLTITLPKERGDIYDSCTPGRR